MYHDVGALSILHICNTRCSRLRLGLGELYLEACASLRSCVIYAGPSTNRVWTTRLELLERIPHTLRRFTVEFRDRSHTDALPLADLAPLLSRFSHLENVRFCYNASGMFARHPLEGDVKARIREALPALEQHNVLRWDGDVVRYSPVDQETKLQLRSTLLLAFFKT